MPHTTGAFKVYYLTSNNMTATCGLLYIKVLKKKPNVHSFTLSSLRINFYLEVQSGTKLSTQKQWSVEWAWCSLQLRTVVGLKTDS